MNHTIMMVILTCIISGVLHAQTPMDSTKSLNNVVITGRKKNIKERAEFKRHAQSTEALSEEELNRNNPAFLEQSLGTMAGVQVDKRTQLGGQRIVIRGYGNDQKFNNWGVKAYFDGIPLTTADGITILDDIDFSVVNNMEIIKGPASTMYGAGIGGVARFYLKNSDEKGLSLSQNTAVGSFGLLQTATRLEYVTDKSSISANFSHLESKGYREHSGSLKNLFTITGRFSLSNQWSISTFVTHNFSHEGIAGQITYDEYYAGSTAANNAYVIKDARLNFQTTRFGLSSNYQFNKNISNQTAVFFSNTDQLSVSAGAYGITNTPNYGVRSVFNIKTGMDHEKYSNQLSIGTEIQQNKQLASSYRFTGSTIVPLQVQPIQNGGSYFNYLSNQQLFFVHDNFTFKKLDLSLVVGLSMNLINYKRQDLLASPGLIAGYNKDLSFEKTFDANFNPHIAIQKTIKNHIINLSYSEGYNAPPSVASFINTVNRVNDSLKAEKGRMIDFSVHGLLFNTKLDYQIAVFGILVNDKLSSLSAIDPISKTPYNFTANTGKQFNKGAEISIGYLIEPINKKTITSITPFLNYSWFDFKYQDFTTRVANDAGILADSNYSGKRVVGVPIHKLSVGLDFKLAEGFYLSNTLNYMGEVYTDFANTANNLVRSYALLNMKVGYQKRIGKFEFDAYIAGNNLTNAVNYTFLFVGAHYKDYDIGSGYPANTNTNVNPGPSRAYFWGGLNLKYHF